MAAQIGIPGVPETADIRTNDGLAFKGGHSLFLRVA